MKIDAIFGKLTHRNSVIHRLDARVKMFGLIAIMVLCFLGYGIKDESGYGYYANQFLVLGILCIIILVLMLLAKVSIISFFKSLAGMWFMIVFLLIIMVFIPTNSGIHVLYKFSDNYTIYYDGLLQCAQIVLRIVMMISLTMILTSTTSPMEITYALEWYFTPLKLLHFPTQIVSMILSLALRMIPTILLETDKITQAQKSRGVDFNKGFLVAKVKSLTTLIVPLMISCFSKSDEMAMAMYARGYDPYKKRSSYRGLKFKWTDLIAAIIILLILGIFIFLSVVSQNNHVNFFDLFGVHGTW